MDFIEKITGDGPYIIAEIGNNHNGSFDRALQMAKLAADAGADCVKFQMRTMADLYRTSSLGNDGNDLGTEYILDLLEKYELTSEQHIEIKNYCESVLEVDYLCTPWDISSARFLNKMDVSGFKVASADLTNIQLLNELISYNKPLIVSTGMSTSSEISKTAELLNSSEADFVLLHCNSTYPAPFADINLNYMHCLKEHSKYVGYSGHERGFAPTLAAVALGAVVVERHFTLDRNMEGPDHSASLEYDEFKSMVQSVKQVYQSLGSNSKDRQLSQGELMNRENLGKSLVASHAISRGTVLQVSDVCVKSPGQGISPQRLEDLIGTRIERDMIEDDYFFESDITGNIARTRDWSFSRKWGIPIRYHDFSTLTPNSSSGIDLLEFHLSYQDMELNPEDFLVKNNELEFLVHAPELFENSELLDLTSADDEYRERSINNMQRVIDLTRDLKKFFPNSVLPGIITNVGGFSMDEPFDEDTITARYDVLVKSLGRLDQHGVEILIQTMAPFPWHFGGQRYQNLFINSDEIEKFCSLQNMKMCFDVSHSWLACQHLNIDFYEFSKAVAPFARHLHLSDARGVNGEGFQVGEGDINFTLLGEILRDGCPDASFIPEVWQGHKNNGEGFWVALERLSGVI
tara:strand:+ start:2677 stop:4572 length:1896 start_codon:yes stop_codon:yes gene_type:complete